VERFGGLELETRPREARLDRDLDRANAYFESDVAEVLPRDADIYFIRFEDSAPTWNFPAHTTRCRSPTSTST